MTQTVSGYLDVPGGKLYYEAAGAGQAVVFVHAGIADHRMWDDQFAVFAEKYRVVRYDTRGFGQTTSESVEFSNRADLRALLDHLGIDKAVLIGCSRGGQIATDTTLEFPERVTALITVGSGPGGFTDGDTSDEDALYPQVEAAEKAGDTEKLIQLDVQIWGSGLKRSVDVMPASFIAKMVEMGRANYQHISEQLKPIVLDPPGVARLHEIKVPALILWGDLDTNYILAASPALADGIPGAQRAVMTGTAHLPNMERPEEFNRLVLDFLESALK